MTAVSYALKITCPITGIWS